jgi:DNA-binding NarL/FixJ family response regulator
MDATGHRTDLGIVSAAGIRCLIADDHPAVLQAMSGLLSDDGISVVASGRDGAEAAAKIQELLPSVAVVDIRMPGLSGVEVARAAAESSPATAVILYTGFAEQALLFDALDAGARGFVLKEAPLEELERAVQIVAAGGVYVDPVLAGLITSGEATRGLKQLTERERDVLRLLADGLRNEEIGESLHISVDTVRTHMRKAMKKLDADTRTQAVATALRQSLL